MTPAGELRAAAKKLREMGAAATQGPWRRHDTWLDKGGFTATVLSDHGDTFDLRAWLPTYSNEPGLTRRNVWNDAAWIALMGPDKAALLATWLEDVAHKVAENVDMLAADLAALRFARAVLGEKP